MTQFLFNATTPREFKDVSTGEIKYCLPKLGEKMHILSLDDIQTKLMPVGDLPKSACPWGQLFNNGYRTGNSNCKWEEWNNFTFADVDSKWFYDLKKRFDVNLLLKMIITNADTLFADNFYAIWLSASGTSFKMLWYWDCPKSEENFTKCTILTEKYTRDLFYSCGENAAEIIDFEENGHRVLDHCSKSSKQGFYVTKNQIYFTNHSDDETFGACNLDDVTLEDLYSINKAVVNHGNVKEHEFVTFKEKVTVDKNGIKYYPHHLRRCIYEALIVVFENKDKVDEEWKLIANMIPENNQHKHSFYEEEPDKNHWYDRFDKNQLHKTDWLEPFGYKFNTKFDYIYKKHFEKSWKSHVSFAVAKLYVLSTNDFSNMKKKEQEEAIMALTKETLTNNSDIFSKFYDTLPQRDNLSQDDVLSYMDKITELRNQYYKTRFEAEDFKYLTQGYEIAKDIVTYKMYADFYYRDENNIPLLKYDILEDNIETYSYWFETGKVQWHTFKYGDEFTHWANNDTFSNKATKKNIEDAIKKFVPRWYSYHSIKDYLNNLDLTKANKELLETWAIRYFNADDTPLNRTLSRNFFIAAVKKMFIEDPTKFVFPHILFLQGPTGCGKTFFLTNMFTIDGHSYILNKIDPDGDDIKIGPLIGKSWLIQYGEGASLKHTDNNTQKEFVDRMNMGIKFQKKFENEQTIVYPRVVLCRTSNEETNFNDDSVSEGDRRNWLIVCKCEAYHCDTELKTLIKDEKDILWATAVKLYLDDPDIDLELNKEESKALNEIQEPFKLINKDDVKEIYDEIFNRDYMLNSDFEFLDEEQFDLMLKTTDEFLTVGSTAGASRYNIKHSIFKVPSKWVRNYVKDKYGISSYRLLKKYILSNEWDLKTAGWHGRTTQCFIIKNKDLTQMKHELQKKKQDIVFKQLNNRLGNIDDLFDPHITC